ncbi:hypothetical protein D3C72_1382160 [compost metagenome]
MVSEIAALRGRARWITRSGVHWQQACRHHPGISVVRTATALRGTGGRAGRAAQQRNVAWQEIGNGNAVHLRRAIVPDRDGVVQRATLRELSGASLGHANVGQGIGAAGIGFGFRWVQQIGRRDVLFDATRFHPFHAQEIQTPSVVPVDTHGIAAVVLRRNKIAWNVGKGGLTGI